MPHGAKLRWDPTWTTLDDLRPDSTVAAVLPGHFAELTWDYGGDAARRTFFGVRPNVRELRAQTALELTQRAHSSGAEVLVLPEVCFDVEAMDAVARWVEDASDLCVAVCGSAHRVEKGRRENVSFIAAARETSAQARAEQPKLRPFVMRAKLDGAEKQDVYEDIHGAGQTLTLLSGRRLSLLVLICMDFIDHDLSAFARALRPSLVIVPASTPTTGAFAGVAGDLAARHQAHVVVVNQVAHGAGDGEVAMISRPHREGRDVPCATGQGEGLIPGVRTVRLSKGAWESDP